MVKKGTLIKYGLLAIFAALFAVLIVSFNVSVDRANDQIDAMNERNRVECESKGGTYTPKPLYAYETSCVSAEGYYMQLDSYTQDNSPTRQCSSRTQPHPER